MPIDPYAASQYYQGATDTLSGVNQRGDSANGMYGSLTQAANQYANSAPDTSNNPYGDILNYIQPQIQRPRIDPLSGAPGGFPTPSGGFIPSEQPVSYSTSAPNFGTPSGGRVLAEMAASAPQPDAYDQWRQSFWNTWNPALYSDTPVNTDIAPAPPTAGSTQGRLASAPQPPPPQPPPPPPLGRSSRGMIPSGGSGSFSPPPPLPPSPTGGMTMGRVGGYTQPTPVIPTGGMGSYTAPTPAPQSIGDGINRDPTQPPDSRTGVPPPPPPTDPTRQRVVQPPPPPPPPPSDNTQGRLPSAPPPNPHPEWWSNTAWQEGQSWGKTPGYEYLAQNPAYIDEYYNWVAGGPAAGQDRSQVDIVDWLAARGQNSPAAGRRGYDTFSVSGPNGTPTPWSGTGSMPNQEQAATPPAPTPGNIRTPGGGMIPMGGSGSYTPPAGGIPPITPAPSAPPTGSPHGPTGPEVPPPTTGNPRTTGQPPAPITDPVLNPPIGDAGVTPATPTTQPQSGTPLGANSNDIYALLHQLMAPENAYESQQLTRNMDAAAALTGGLNSGGFAESLGRAQSQLAASQGQRMSDYLNTNDQNALNRALQYYGINTTAQTAANQTKMQGFIAQLQTDTQKFGIQTNADLQKYLDSQDNALKQYGIDKNDLLARYQAELQNEGVKYSADAQVKSAELHRAASNAMAAAQQAGQIAQIQAEQAIRQQEVANQYTEFQANLANRQYEFTHPSIDALLNLYAAFTPEQIAHMGLPPITQVYGP